jgi:uncharacterized protein (TIGR02757 family)
MAKKSESRVSKRADFLNERVETYNQPAFIDNDPVCIPHLFSRKQDQEIAGFFAAIFAWGNRTTIINKSKELMNRMDNSPYDFCTEHSPEDLKKLLGFRHRTFTDTDLLYFISFFHFHYRGHDSLEDAFTGSMSVNDLTTENALKGFHPYFFSLEHVPARTRKHIATPDRHATCKRLNMFLRWMVRNDGKGVDLGLWKNIKPSQLICPIDLHVSRVAKRFELLKRKSTDWEAAVELTASLRQLDPADPVKYDFALFSLGIYEKF